MILVPRDFAKEATQFIIEHPRCNIWADPGMGKTSITLAAFDILWIASSSKFPVLVIAPLRVARSVWTNEIKKWDCFSNLNIVEIIGSNPAMRTLALNKGIAADVEIFTINFENIPWLVDHLSTKWPFKSIVADESTKLKGFRLRHGAKRAAALAKAAKYTARWINLTGTPVPNGLVDLWGQQWFIDAGVRLGTSHTAFISRWFDEDKYAKTIEPKVFAEEQIIDLISDVTMNINAADYLDIKEPLKINVMVDLPSGARKIYRDMERNMCAEVENAPLLEAKTAADLSIKLLQVASGACFRTESLIWDTIHDAKIEALKDLLDEMSGNPLLVAYHFKADLTRILEAIPQARHIQSLQDEDDWNDGKILCGLVHPASAGHGLNLQHGGHHIAFFSHWWNLEHYLQVIERIGPVRQLQSGYDRIVFIYHIIARGTIDEDVMVRRETKRSTQSIIRDRVQRIRKGR